MATTIPDQPLAVSYRLPLSNRGPIAAVHGGAVDAARENALLRANLRWFCQLRWIVVAVLGSTGLAAALFRRSLAEQGIQLSPMWPLLAGGVLAIANLVYTRVLPSAPRPKEFVTARTHLWIQIVVDLLILTAVIHYLGGAGTNAPFAYLFHIVLACIFFRPKESFAVTGVAAGLYVGCLLLESAGMLPAVGVWGAPAAPGAGVSPFEFWALHVGSTLAIWIIIWYLVSRLAGTLRQRERELAATSLRLEASSRERMKHMLQTTHQLKSPFAAIHANTQLLLQGYCGNLPERAIKVAQKIAVRSATLSEQIQSMLQLANLRSVAQSAPPDVEVDLGALIHRSVERAAASASQRRIQIELDLKPLEVRAAEDHVVMLIDNVVTNAVNYSFDGGVVRISTASGPDDSAVVTVRDHGIGIPAEKLPRIFDDYYRTEEAAKHCRLSTGLGLAVVRDVAIASGVEVRVESAPGWGTRFWLTIPRNTARQDSRN